ncbi:class I SAM-dependent methyltransferase [Rubrivivax gelatinosus]|uniref:Methyltransferase family protein n=1 Tax=Rubrivivax gelatinosus TaxID=28068 RepID=A0A4R2M9N5_RUBGE|nr:class I SAM-dependent methyltransferase [Rubrivivax gelatinosus]TCP03120.1 methyltransferase family protein [Rubrivivax gelatinosus]
MNTAQERRRAWDGYWASGALHSCAGSFDGNYGGAIASFWRETFMHLQPGERVLDLACGNGPLGRLLLECRDDASIGCDAVDLATPSPRWLSEMPAAQAARLRFHGGVAAESLPFDDGRFALVTSQYGLEYTDLARSVAELQRVLRRPGRIALLVHHAGSRPVALAHDEITHLDWLGAEDGLLDSVARIVPLVDRAQTPQGRAALAQDASAERQRQHFNSLQQALSRRAEASICPDVLYEVRDAAARLFALAGGSGSSAALEGLGRLRRHLMDSRIRLEDLCRCALDADGVAALSQRLAPAARTAELHESGHLMGWTLVATLPG